MWFVQWKSLVLRLSKKGTCALRKKGTCTLRKKGTCALRKKGNEATLRKEATRANYRDLGLCVQHAPQSHPHQAKFTTFAFLVFLSAFSC